MYKETFTVDDVLEYIKLQYPSLLKHKMPQNMPEFIRGYIIGYGKYLKAENQLIINPDTGLKELPYEHVLTLSNDFFLLMKDSIDKKISNDQIDTLE